MAARTKQVEIMIEEFNKYLKENHIRDEYCAEVHIFIHLLLKIKCYQGFNWFYEYTATNCVGIPSKVQCYACTSDMQKLKELNAYIQIL